MRTILGVEVEIREQHKENDKKDFEEKCRLEADVIVTAVVLGFIGTRYHLNQPCRFDHEHPSPELYENWDEVDVGKRKMKPEKEEEFLAEYQAFQHVMSAMSFVLDKSKPGMGAFLSDSQSLEWAPGALITGRAGGQMLEADERHRKMQMDKSREKATVVTKNPLSLARKGSDSLYLGKGAYTGMIDDPVNDQILIQRTKRVLDKTDERWKPGAGASDKPWGLIVALDSERNNTHLASLDKGGLGPLHDDCANYKDGERIGYIHGMISAINKSISAGPWCTPYELATGKETTKMASCFACTTYMYANGYPPSSTHLGQGASWVPPKFDLKSAEKEDASMPDYFTYSVKDSLFKRWNWDIHHYLDLGSKYLSNAIKATTEENEKFRDAGLGMEAINYVNNDHQGSVKKLCEALKTIKERADIGEIGGNLFLDALTVHDSDWKRVRRTLQPVYDYYDDKKGARRLKDEIAAGNILVK